MIRLFLAFFNVGPSNVDTFFTALHPGAPFTSHCLLFCLVWGVWKDTADSSMVTIRSNIALEWWRTSDKKAPQVLTLSFFMSWLRSLGTHRADFFERWRSSWRVAWIILVDTPWASQSFRTVTRLSLATWAVISATKVGSRILRLPLKSLWSAACFPSLTLRMISYSCVFFKALSPQTFFTVSSISLNGFPATARAPMKSRIGGRAYSGGGWREKGDWRACYSQ